MLIELSAEKLLKEKASFIDLNELSKEIGKNPFGKVLVYKENDSVIACSKIIPPFFINLYLIEIIIVKHIFDITPTL